MMKKAAFIGIGVMGKSMAGHLMDKGYSLSVYTRTKTKADELIKKGAIWADTVQEAAAEADFVITMVGYPHDVEAIYLGENGIIESAKTGAILIDMTTSKPSLAIRIADAARSRGLEAIDAPVSGGDVGAREAKLAIMAGGDRDAFEKCLPLFEAMGNNIVYQGPAGSGQHTKMSNQIAIASGMIAACEALAYAEKSGLDPENVLKSISTGAAGSWSLSNLAPRMLKGNFEPGFYVKHFIKDMKIAKEESESFGMKVPGLDLALSLYEKLEEMGEENSGTHALYKLWKQERI
ncbi:NAD(P)-dependent oxidoreductase [Bacillus sp. FJAT-42376]|uniref:NAD(P)-dependent oxidoreductase n=1 Tax=Bacillus sp. FJAT-42376 TaxID=2014076 RepID=UPI000F4F85DF|nr:NAD(P)-dependent oxidoreductase [Bacillus sp. FJAT-42376]AZB42600.1 NAD(P)-dependent oxidoreductase [Bacillus sp. FJAT-42376]